MNSQLKWNTGDLKMNDTKNIDQINEYLKQLPKVNLIKRKTRLTYSSFWSVGNVNPRVCPEKKSINIKFNGHFNKGNYVAFCFAGTIVKGLQIQSKIKVQVSQKTKITFGIIRDGSKKAEATFKSYTIEPGVKHELDAEHLFQDFHIGLRFQIGVNSDESVDMELHFPLIAKQNKGIDSLEITKGQTKKLSSLLSHYLNSINQNPNFYLNYHRLGETLWKLGRLDEAVEAFSKAVLVNNKARWSHFCLGQILAEQEEWQDAIVSYQKAVKLELLQPQLFYKLGIAMTAIQLWEQAAEAYQKAIELDETRIQSSNNFGDTLLSKNTTEKGIIFYELGTAMTAIKLWERATEAYQKAIELDETQQKVYYKHLGDALLQQMKWEEAITAYKTAINLGYEWNTRFYTFNPVTENDIIEFFYYIINQNPQMSALDCLFQFYCIIQSVIDRRNGRHQQIQPIAVDFLDSLESKIINEVNSYAFLNTNKQKKSEIKKVAICCGVLRHGKTLNHARLIFEFAKNLSLIAPNLQLYIVNTNEVPYFNPFKTTPSRHIDFVEKEYLINLEQFAKDILGDLFELKVKFVSYPLLNNFCQKLSYIVDKIIEINPDAIIYLGCKGANESFFVRRGLFDFFPTLYLFSQMIIKVDQYNDIYLARNNHDLVGSYDKSKVRVTPYPIKFNKSDSDNFVYDVSYVKKSPNEITLVSVLNGARMGNYFSSYSSKTRLLMMNLLKIENTRWFWIGPSNKDKVLSIDPTFTNMYQQGKLEIIQFEENLRAFYHHCDLFLHLPRFTGGGGGLSIALLEGLPVLCFENTDPSHNVAKEYRFQSDDIEKFFQTAEFLILNQESRKTAAINCRNYYENLHIQDRAGLIYQALLDAQNYYNIRNSFT